MNVYQLTAVGRWLIIYSVGLSVGVSVCIINFCEQDTQKLICRSLQNL